MTRTDAAASANAEATEAWDGPLYDRFVHFREVIIAGLTVHGEEALRLFPAPRGGRVIDLGCRSWLELHRDLPFEGTPVLSDEEFERAAEEIEAIASSAVPVLA